jgi:quercetin dioxygenase-like cupin family protein
MKRNAFIMSILTILASPFIAMAQKENSVSPPRKGFKIGAGVGRKHGHLKLKGVNANILDVKISGSDTAGDLAIFEQTSLSQGRGTPLHLHKAQDEVFYVIEGSYRFKVGEDLFSLTNGDSIFLPRQVPHAWTQESKSGRMIVVLQPAGKLENFFVSMASLDHEPTAKEVGNIFASNDMEVLGPALTI